METGKEKSTITVEVKDLLNKLINMIGSNRPRSENDPAFFGGIVDVHQYGKTAIVKVRVENNRVIYTDYLSLLKIDGEWKIIHKIWDTELQND
jgi:hypothetical protein